MVGSLEKLPPEDDKGAEQRKRVLTSCWDAIEEEINVSSHLFSSCTTLIERAREEVKLHASLFLSCILKIYNCTQFLSLKVVLLQTILSDQHGKVIDDLLHFISKSQKHLEDLYSRCKAAKRQELLLHQKKLLPPRLEISTAVLLAGVNMPDHDVLLKHLQAKIRDQISPYVVLLKSRDCNSGRKMLRDVSIHTTKLKAKLSDDNVRIS